MKELQTTSFFKKPEGKVGSLFLIPILGGLGYGAYKIMPYVVTLLENTLYVSILSIGVFVLAYAIMDGKVRNLIWYLYKSVMRKITAIFIELDPIAIIETYVSELKHKILIMNEQLSDLRGQIENLSGIINKNKKDYDNFMSLAKTAKEQSKNELVITNSRKAQRTLDSNENFIALRNKIQKIYEVLHKMRGYSNVMVEDVSHEVEMKKVERKAIRKSYSIMKSALKIINGNSDEAEMFDSAMEHIAFDIRHKIGEMEDFMLASEDVISNMDLTQANLESKGLEKLDEWINALDKKYEAELYIPISANQKEHQVEFNTTNTKSNTNKYF